MPARPVSRDDDNGCGEWTVPFELRQRGFGVGGGDCKVDKGGTAGACGDDGGGTRQQMASAQHAARAAAAVAALAAAAPVLQRARLMADAEIYAVALPCVRRGPGRRGGLQDITDQALRAGEDRRIRGEPRHAGIEWAGHAVRRWPTGVRISTLRPARSPAPEAAQRPNPLAPLPHQRAAPPRG